MSRKESNLSMRSLGSLFVTHPNGKASIKLTVNPLQTPVSAPKPWTPAPQTDATNYSTNTSAGTFKNTPGFHDTRK